jgi:hypothetical protein
MTRSRYYLRTPYLRFYFRFIEPNLGMIELELTDLLWERIAEQTAASSVEPFRAFVGVTAFENLCREWTLTQARAGALPFMPARTGGQPLGDRRAGGRGSHQLARAGHPAGGMQMGREGSGRSVIRELVEKAKRVVPGEGWWVHYAFFAHAGFTHAARAEGVAGGVVGGSGDA